MKVYDLKFLLDKKSQEAGAYCLSHAPKTGIMHASSLQLEMANRYVYEAFQPIIEETGITKSEFFNNEKTKRGYRNAYINMLYIARKYPNNFLQAYPNLFSEDGNISIKEFTRVVNDINKKWLEFKKALKENPSKEQHLDTLREQVAYTGFFATDPKNRNFLMAAARDQNRTEDKNIFKSLEPYIIKKESVDYQQFMDSPELRGLYRKKYLAIKGQLEQEQNPARCSYETVDEAIQRISQKWSSIATMSQDISKDSYERFATKYPIETFFTLTPLEIERLDHQTLKLKQNIIDQQYQQMMAEKSKETEQLRELNQKFHNDLGTIWKEATAENLAESKDFFTILNNARKKQGETTPGEAVPRKK